MSGENRESSALRLSSLPKTWLFDIDGTLVKHNGFLENDETLLAGVKEFFKNLPSEDIVILLTARKTFQIPAITKFLKENNIRFHHIIADLPVGERILINDCKPANEKNKNGLKTAYAINTKRDEGIRFTLEIDEGI
ncbi:hypothetical protein [Helicobacter himalayensis]|uniref:hypothetical protein n=1 Tax=Helicobacter himalayensis TaxID=1591088 RepID=UPI000836092A|nr:hypothetical protein [Helicobacter himalayensis]